MVNAHSKSEKSPSQADFLLHKAFSIFKKESTEFIKTSYPGPTILDKERIRMIQTILVCHVLCIYKYIYTKTSLIHILYI